MRACKVLPVLLPLLMALGAVTALLAQVPSFSPIQALARPVSQGEVKVVIMADTQTTTGDIKGVNAKIFGRLLELAKKKKPSALFIAGDLVGGQKVGKPRPGLPRSFEAEEDEGSAVFQYEYDRWLKCVKQHWDKSIPVYPITGNHDTRILGSTKAFQKTFDMKCIWSPKDPRARLTAYGVTIQGVRFLLPALEYFDLEKRVGVEDKMPAPVMAWLAKDLAQQQSARYRFVVSHEPIWGGKKARDGREGVAKLLEAGKVTAYFCGHWHRYQRNKHGDTWQIVTGGAGGRMDKKPDPGDFNHYTLLTIPAGGGRPHVTVYDIQDKVRDSFDL